MKRNILLMIILLLTLSACVTPQNTDVEAELRATLVAVNVQSTVQAQQIASLQTQVMQPTATCPACPIPSISPIGSTPRWVINAPGPALMAASYRSIIN